ncbi:MAG: hypothetical protein HC925_01175 [Coleofasciculaceae cyanobacterium SM2_3_26]|nr:hypothetical protein [Coleofasciculaceae cyanobacterium SM2_3_26]
MRKSSSLLAGMKKKLVRSYNDFFDRTLGFMTWKIGCDLGFFLVATEVGNWERAFTWIGLVPYTIAQYLIYHFVGQRMILEGQSNPFAPSPSDKNLAGKPPLWRQLVAKFFHESLNETSYNVPLRQVTLKPFVDYGGIILSWPLYTVGLLFLQSGEINFAPIAHFFFLKMVVFYLVNTFGFIIGFNLGEVVYVRILEVSEFLERWTRENANPSGGTAKQGLLRLATQLQELKERWVEFKYVAFWQVDDFLNRYSLNARWFVCSTFGIVSVVLLEPSMADALFAISATAQKVLFNLFGHMDQIHITQAAANVVVADMGTSSGELVDAFPELWEQVFFPDR